MLTHRARCRLGAAMTINLATHPRPYVTAGELAEWLWCDRRTIVRMIHNGSLKGTKVGRNWRIPTEDARRAFHVEREQQAS